MDEDQGVAAAARALGKPVEARYDECVALDEHGQGQAQRLSIVAPFATEPLIEDDRTLRSGTPQDTTDTSPGAVLLK